jgi:hypothetical protein
MVFRPALTQDNAQAWGHLGPLAPSRRIYAPTITSPWSTTHPTPLRRAGWSPHAWSRSSSYLQNQLPVYLVISPSHEPHLSLLPVLLTLELESQLDPLSVLLKCDIGKSFNPTLDGVAPWADLWVPLGIARQILHDVGAGRLFWSKDGRGLLGDVDDAVSWEEDGGWSHKSVCAHQVTRQHDGADTSAGFLQNHTYLYRATRWTTFSRQNGL